MEVEITKHIEFTVCVSGHLDNEGDVTGLKMTLGLAPGQALIEIPAAMWEDLVSECEDELRAEAVRRIREDGE